jgi:predicted dehydrogenase
MTYSPNGSVAERWQGIERPYTPAEVLRLQGSLRIEHTLALVLPAVVAGKHIVCDKPLGISLAEYDTAVAAARGVALGLNLVLRHHRLYRAPHGLAQSRVLGAPRRLAVENYADEGRGFGLEHWLWDPARSGGLALASDIGGRGEPP